MQVDICFDMSAGVVSYLRIPSTSRHCALSQPANKQVIIISHEVSGPVCVLRSESATVTDSNQFLEADSS